LEERKKEKYDEKYEQHLKPIPSRIFFFACLTIVGGRAGIWSIVCGGSAVKVHLVIKVIINDKTHD